MNISFKDIHIGHTYDRKELAAKWGYKSFHAIGRGAVLPRNTPFIIFFITREKQKAMTQYKNRFFEGVLEIEGEKNHVADSRIVKAQTRGDEIHLFYRDRHHSAFIYEGQVLLYEYELRKDKPSEFVFITDNATAAAYRDIMTEAATHGTKSFDPYEPESEGTKKAVQTWRYERSVANRKKALAVHGRICVVCGFDFDAVYGEDLAHGYIEIHHTTSVSELQGVSLDIEKHFASVCSNCHSMAHRQRGKIISLDDLRERVARYRE